MATRIVILSAFTLFFGLLAVFEYEYGNSFTFLIFFLVGLLSIGGILWSHLRFKLVNNHLVVEQPFRNAFSVDLTLLIRWKMLSYYIRGQQKKTLVLIAGNGKKIILSNIDYAVEFEELLTHLIKNYQSLKM